MNYRNSKKMYYLRSHCFYLLCFEDQTLPKITKDGLSNKD